VKRREGTVRQRRVRLARHTAATAGGDCVARTTANLGGDGCLLQPVRFGLHGSFLNPDATRSGRRSRTEAGLSSLCSSVSASQRKLACSRLCCSAPATLQWVARRVVWTCQGKFRTRPSNSVPIGNGPPSQYQTIESSVADGGRSGAVQGTIDQVQ
jgi:hypothetical protein